ncbi:MAG: hypothetical protein HKN45_01065 [Flavobacteriales bacterium]|nr:hypothetical protein [Flavobacteriales bacterium]NNK81318.1 hypothetical protein [Flavobacteriales bacterium]
MSDLNKDTGQLITADDGASMLQSYLQKHNIDPANPPAGEYWATYFGINRLKDLVREIDSYNAGPKPNGEIIGIRVYRCDSEHDGRPAESALVIPVTENEKDLYPISTQKSITQFTPNTILEMGFPCPPWCPKD